MLLWQQRRWRTLLNLIDHIPAASYLGEVLANDEDAARAWLARNSDEPQSDTGPRFSQWDPVVAELTVLSDRVGSLISATAAVGGSQITIPVRPRPAMAIDRVREQARIQKHNDLVRRLLPASAN